MKGKRKNDIKVKGSGEMKMLGEEQGQKIVNIKKKNVKNNFRKIGKKKIMMQMLIWFNWSITIINATLQLLDIYRSIHINLYKFMLLLQ